MCLRVITGIPKKKSGIGYKVYQFKNDQLHTMFYNQYLSFGSSSSTPLEIGKEYCATRLKETDNSGKTYNTGFHIFVDSDVAAQYAKEVRGCVGDCCVVEVQYKNANVEGEEHCDALDAKCVVAGKMTITKIISMEKNQCEQN